MQSYTETDVLAELRKQISRSSGQKAAAAALGFTAQFIGQVLKGKKRLTADLALRLGFVKLPDSYMRAEQKKGKSK